MARSIRAAYLRATEPLRLFLDRTDRSFRVAAALGDLGKVAMSRAGMMETSPSHRSIVGLGYSIYWWAVFLLVLLAPTYSSEPSFYFPAVLALAVTWLLTMPSYGQSLLAADFSALKPPGGTWRLIVEAFEGKGVEVPADVRTEAAEASVDAMLPQALPSVLLVVLLQLIYRLSVRAALLGFVGIVGLLVGPVIAQVHLWRGWSPVALLYAVSAPWAVLLLISLLMPPSTQIFIAGLRADAALSSGEETDPTAKP